jgi:NADP-dependent 3-hydroxy acid dehydrogenase YdfG
MERALRELDGLDVVVNNAGIARVTPFAEATADDWRAIVDVNPPACSTAAVRRRRT